MDSSLDEVVLLKIMQEINGHHTHYAIGGPTPTRISPKRNTASLNKISFFRTNEYPDENYFKEFHATSLIEHKLNRL